MSAPRRLRLDESSGRIAIEFPYDRSLIDVVREIPGRRWDPDRKLWTAPLEVAAEVVRVLGARGFVVDASLAERLDRNPAPARPAADREPSGPARNELEAADPWPAELGYEPLAENELPPLELLEGDWQPPPSLTDPGPPEQPSAATLASASAPAPASNEEVVPADQAHLSVSELNQQVRLALRRRFPRAIWVVGQVSGWDRNAHKQHVFFELTEKDTEGEQEVARVTTVLFGGMRSRVLRRLAEGGEELGIQDGVQVRLLVKVDLYGRSGSYQVVVEDIDPAYTLGVLALNREKVLKELEKRGLATKNRDLPPPPLPLRVALISSWGSDAANDVIAELRRSGYAFKVAVYDAFMQGPRLEASVGAALSRVAACNAEYDICLICRGGGSRTDLAWFDNLAVALAVAELPLKVIVGIGHHRDLGALDLIAYSEKTPTAAADFLVTTLASREAELEERAAVLERLVRGGLKSGRLDLSHRGVRFRRAALLATHRAAELLGAGEQRLTQAGRHSLTRVGSHLNEARATLVFLARGSLRNQWLELQGRRDRLIERGRAQLRLEQERLTAKDRQILAHDPRRLLRRGFAIVRNAVDGHMITGIQQTQVGADIRVELRDGLIDARVESVEEKEDEQPQD